MDLLISEGRPVFSRPSDALLRTDLEQEPELLIEELVIVAQIETEERIRFRKRTASGYDLGTPLRDEVERREFLKDPYRIGGAQDGHGTRQTNSLRAGGSRGKQDNGCGIEEFLTMMLSDSKDIEPNAISGLDFLEKIPEAHHGINLGTGDWIASRGDEAIDPNFHG
jgi:hypothetical protein